MIDNHLIKDCIKNDSRSQKMLFDQVAPVLMGVATRYADSYDEASDILQDAMIKIFQKLDQFQFNGSFEGWCRRVLINTALEHIRKKNILKYSESIEEQYELGLEDANALEQLNAKELLEMIQTLPSGYKTVFNLYAIEGFSHKEIAEMLGLSEGTSKSQYARARKYLMELISKNEMMINYEA